MELVFGPRSRKDQEKNEIFSNEAWVTKYSWLRSPTDSRSWWAESRVVSRSKWPSSTYPLFFPRGGYGWSEGVWARSWSFTLLCWYCPQFSRYVVGLSKIPGLGEAEPRQPREIFVGKVGLLPVKSRNAQRLYRIGRYLVPYSMITCYRKSKKWARKPFWLGLFDGSWSVITE